MAKLGEDVGVFANAAGILAQRGIEHMVQTVFDVPMASDSRGFHRSFTGDEVIGERLARLETPTAGVKAFNAATDFDHGFEVMGQGPVTVPAGKGQSRAARCSIRLRQSR